MVRTRIAPSPTGEDIHIGNLYAAFINWAWARKYNGKFIIRIEDTDKERFVEGAQKKILSTIKSFGIDYDEGPDVGGEFGPYQQSKRLAIYKKHAQELVDKGFAYYCFCSKERLDQLRGQQALEKKEPRYDRYCLENVKNPQDQVEAGEPFIVRLKVPKNQEIVFEDVIRGKIKFDSNNIDDQVLIKSDGYPTYHLAVVIDDFLMKITHIIRAEEWISSTPKHILLYRAFGWEVPVFAHLPILRNPDRSKLSKRKNPVWASWYLEKGYLPEAILNYLSLMGWSHPQQKEIFAKEEFIDKFDLKDVLPVGPAFNPAKLSWINGVYIRNLSSQTLKKRLLNFDKSLSNLSQHQFDLFLDIAKTRMTTLKDFGQLVFPFLSPVSKNQENNKKAEELISALSLLSFWDKESILASLKSFVQEKKLSFQDLYRMTIGQDSGLPLADAFAIIGKEKTAEIIKGLKDK